MRTILATTIALALAAPVYAAPVARGVDVSDHQGQIDWGKAAASGLSFAIVRVSDGLQHPDSQFQANWNGTRAHGIVRGVYQYFRPGQDPVAQADLLISRVAFEPGDLPPFLDVETMDGVSSSHMRAAIQAWIDRVRKRTGMVPLIYTAPGLWNGYGLPSYPGVGLWVANWGVSAPKLPHGWSDWTFWQTSASAHVAGIPSGADGDVFHGSAADLRAFAASHGPGGSGSGVSTTTTVKPILREGATGQDVVALQDALAAHGFSPGASDGDFGPRTLAAVIAFQRSRGLVADGVVGPLTWAALSH